MKTTYKPRPKKIVWSEGKKESCRQMKWKHPSDADGGLRSDAQCPASPSPPTASAPGVGPGRQSGVFRPVTKWTNYTTDLITRSSPLMLQTMRKNAQKSRDDISVSPGALLPPIRGSRMTHSAVIAANPFISKARTADRADPSAEQLTCLSKENALFRLYVTKQGKPGNLFESHLVPGSVAGKRSQSVAPLITGEGARAKNKPVAVRCQPVTWAEEQRSSAIDTCPSDSQTGVCAVKHACGKKELPGGGAHCGPGREERKGSDVSGRLQSGDYYTDQKISEWILNVNASLFSPSSGSVGSNGPSEEQDTSIKIVYDRE